MAKVLLYFLGFLFINLLSFGSDASDSSNEDDFKIRKNYKMINRSYKNFLKEASSIYFDQEKFATVPCAYIFYLQEQILKCNTKSTSQDYINLLKLSQIDGFYFYYQKLTVTKKQAQFLALIFERSNLFINSGYLCNSNIYTQAIKQHLDLIKENHKQLEKWHDIKDSNKFIDNLWITLSKLGDQLTKNNVGLIKNLTLSQRDVMPQFFLNGFIPEDNLDQKLYINSISNTLADKTGSEFFDLLDIFKDQNSKNYALSKFGYYIRCDFCDHYSWSKTLCNNCKRKPLIDDQRKLLYAIYEFRKSRSRPMAFSNIRILNYGRAKLELENFYNEYENLSRKIMLKKLRRQKIIQLFLLRKNLKKFFRKEIILEINSLLRNYN